MESLKTIIGSLNLSETKALTDILCFKYQKKSTKRLQLFQLISIGKYSDETQVCYKLYGKPKCEAFSQLKKRLKEDFLDAILLLPSYHHGIEPFPREEINCQKLIIQSEFLINRGLVSEAILLLKKAKAKALKYEYHNLSLSINHLIHKYEAKPLKDKCNNQFKKDITQKVDYIREHLVARESHLQSNILELLGSGDKGLTFTNFNDKNLVEAPLNVRFLHQLHTMKRFLRLREFEKALALGNKMQKDLINKPALHTNENTALLYMEMAKANLYLQQYADAINHSLSLLKLSDSGGIINELYASEILFHAYFKSEHYEKASKLANNMIKGRTFDRHRLLGRWYFFSANIEFVQSRYKVCIKKLHKGLVTGLENIHWTAGYKLLELMCLVEMKEYDWFEFRLEAFRKLLQTNRQKPHHRCHIAYQLLKTLSKFNFDFFKVAQQAENALSVIHQGKDQYYCDPLGIEIIKIDHWFLSKCPRTTLEAIK